MSEISSWQPLLDGELAEKAWKTILQIASDLEDAPILAGEVAGHSASLAGGSSGLAIFYTYLALVKDDESLAERADQQLDQSISALATTAMAPELFSGFVGVAWTSRHLEGKLYESEIENEEDDIDRVLLELLDLPSWNREYNLISGLAGYAIHALESLPRPSSRRTLELIIDHLERIKVPTQPGLSWHTPPEWLTTPELELHPNGHFNLGMAYGVPAVLVILARSAHHGIRTERATEMVEGGVTWLLAQYREDLGFPSWIPATEPAAPSAPTWCYGDLGIALALLRTARSLDRKDWEQEALRIAHRFVERTREDLDIPDAGLSHGAVGLAHIYNRLFQATREDLFAEQARSWFEKGLSMARPGAGVGGYLAHLPRPGSNTEWRPDPGFLTGAAGIALGLLAAVSDLEPEWDRSMAIDLPAIPF